MEQLVKERDCYGNAIYPASNNGLLKTGTIDMSKFRRAILVGLVGVLGASGSVAAGLQYGNNANASDSTNMGINLSTNIAINNQQFTIEPTYGAAEMASRRYLCGYLNHITIASQTAAVIYGTEGRFLPASAYNDASVNAQITG